MPKSNREPQHRQGKSKQINRKLPGLGSRSRGSIDRNAFSNVNLSGSKLLLVSLLLTLPYLGVIIALYWNGLKFVAAILVFVGIVLLLAILFMRWIERSNL